VLVKAKPFIKTPEDVFNFLEWLFTERLPAVRGQSPRTFVKGSRQAFDR
jgi:hypothetical protein